MVPFGPYLPDQADLGNPGATLAKNVLPWTANTYAPLKALSPVSAALTNRPQGAASFTQNQGTVHSFAGDNENLFKLSTTTWANVSKSSAAYTVATADTVNFINFGDRVISVNGLTDPPQTYVMGTSSAFADLGGTPPRAKTVAVVKDFVVMGNTYDGTDGIVSNRIWWSAINDPTDWPTIGSADAASKQSDRQDLPVGGEIMAITGAVGGLDGAVFSKRAIYRLQYVGPPTVFNVLEVERDRGTLAPNSVVNVGPFGFYLGEEGFYSFTGAGSQPIGDQKVDRYFLQNDLDRNYMHRIYGAGDPVNRTVWWAYPGVGNSGGRPNKILIYNWAVDRWTTAEIEQEFIYRNLSIQVTLESLDSYGNIDALGVSLDDPSWIGGQTLLSSFNEDKKLAGFTGAPLAASLETQEIGGTDRIFINGVRPYVDGGTVTVTLRHRTGPGDAITETTDNAVDEDGQAHFTVSTRYARAQVNIAAGGDWTHAQGVDAEVVPDGAA
jgi:hypothetical protein